MQFRTIVPLLLASLTLGLISLAPGAFAREVCSPIGDPDFSGAVSIDLTPAGRPPNDISGAPLDLSDFVYQFASNGITFRFEAHTVNPIGWPDNQAIYSWGVVGQPALTLTINPPVEAIGFHGRRVDGCPGGTFAGAGPPPTNEEASVFRCTGTCPPAGFFGAANIGPIGAVDITQSASLFAITEMVFRPPSVLPTEVADLSVLKTEASGFPFVLNGDPLQYQIDVGNAGPDDAPAVLVADFVPAGIFNGASHSGAGVDFFDAATDVYSLLEDPLASQGSVQIIIDATVPSDPRQFSCRSSLTNAALVGGIANDPDLGNNSSLHTVRFDRQAVAGLPEVCGDGIDNNCDGFRDCADPVCGCFQTLPQLPGGNPNCGGGPFGGLQAGLIALGVPPGQGCSARTLRAPRHACTVQRGQCGTVTLPSSCCDTATWSNPDNNLNASACDLQVPGCVPRSSGGLPVDPNFKEADPGTSPLGYGYTDAGRTMTYTIHYENVGTADALQVLVIDVLDPDLDDATLLINDGGSYDSATRTLVWTDPVVPPADPRQVSFQIEVRADAAPGTRVRNTGTIIFPNAEPPSRIDTNFVEHVVPDPLLVIEPELSVLACNETAPGSGRWEVRLVNDGPGFAYNVTAAIVQPPASLSVSDAAAAFSHPDDIPDGSIRSVIPVATTTSEDTVTFATETPADPCPALLWRIEYEDLLGGFFTRDVRSQPDSDLDAVADGADNCPVDFNPGQADSDGDGVGDACDQLDADNDGVLDQNDHCPGTVLPDEPSRGLGINRFADIDADGVFETVPPNGRGPKGHFTIEDTGGCSCAQIIEGLHLGRGHERHGCSFGAMRNWLDFINEDAGDHDCDSDDESDDESDDDSDDDSDDESDDNSDDSDDSDDSHDCG